MHFHLNSNIVQLELNTFTVVALFIELGPISFAVRRCEVDPRREDGRAERAERRDDDVEVRQPAIKINNQMLLRQYQKTRPLCKYAIL